LVEQFCDESKFVDHPVLVVQDMPAHDRWKRTRFIQGAFSSAQSSEISLGAEQLFRCALVAFNSVVQMFLIGMQNRVFQSAARVHFIDHFGVVGSLVGDDRY